MPVCFGWSYLKFVQVFDPKSLRKSKTEAVTELSADIDDVLRTGNGDLLRIRCAFLGILVLPRVEANRTRGPGIPAGIANFVAIVCPSFNKRIQNKSDRQWGPPERNRCLGLFHPERRPSVPQFVESSQWFFCESSTSANRKEYIRHDYFFLLLLLDFYSSLHFVRLPWRQKIFGLIGQIQMLSQFFIFYFVEIWSRLADFEGMGPFGQTKGDLSSKAQKPDSSTEKKPVFNCWKMV